MTGSVTASRVILADPAVPQSVAGHRVDYWTWVEQHAEEYKRRLLLGLRDYWRDCNRDYFDGRMLEPYITLTEPSAPQIYGQCCSVSSWGSRLEIRIRPSLLAGTHPHLLGAKQIHREQFTYDVLLHEMVHQHVMEHQPDVDERSYHGHGPVFTGHCNRIGALLGLPEVVVRNRNGGKDPKAAQWPHCVQPADRYGDFYKPHRRKVTASSDTTRLVEVPADQSQEQPEDSYTLWSPDVAITVTNDTDYEDLKPWVLSLYRALAPLKPDPPNREAYERFSVCCGGFWRVQLDGDDVKWAHHTDSDSIDVFNVFAATLPHLDPLILIANMARWLEEVFGIDAITTNLDLIRMYQHWDGETMKEMRLSASQDGNK